MKTVLLALIRFYRRFISPLRQPCCRFTPTCSQYAMEAIEKYGALAFIFKILYSKFLHSTCNIFIFFSY